MNTEDDAIDSRTFVIHVCPECGYYVSDSVLRRARGIRCFACGERAVKALDLSRVNPAWVHTKKTKARESAPLMSPIEVRRATTARTAPGERLSHDG